MIETVMIGVAALAVIFGGLALLMWLSDVIDEWHGE